MCAQHGSGLRLVPHIKPGGLGTADIDCAAVAAARWRSAPPDEESTRCRLVAPLPRMRLEVAHQLGCTASREVSRLCRRLEVSKDGADSRLKCYGEWTAALYGVPAALVFCPPSIPDDGACRLSISAVLNQRRPLRLPTTGSVTDSNPS